MSYQVYSKLPDVGTTIFTVMSKMAADYDAINLSQGYPDFSVPDGLVERLLHYMQQGQNQYPPMQGIEYLRQQISLKIKDCYGISVDSDTEVTVTSGATEAIFVAIHAVVQKESEVIVLDPAYDAYEPAVTLAGARTIHIPLTGEDFHIDWQRLNDAVNDRTCAIIINSPQNPTGSVITHSDLDELANVVKDRNIAIISDEVYEHMVYDGESHHSVLTHPELREKAFVVFSFGKTYHATGWKVGYCVAPPELTIEFRKVHQFVTFTTHTPTQWAIADFLEHCPEHHQQLSGFYQAKRDLFLKEIDGIGFQLLPARGTYFQLVGYDGLSNKNDVDFVTELTQEVRVAAIPVSVFFEEPPELKVIRFCYAKSDDTLIEAAQRLKDRFS